MAALFLSGLLFSARLLLSRSPWDEVEVIRSEEVLRTFTAREVVDEAVPIDAPLLAKSRSAIERRKALCLDERFNQI
jgi:hypothetical protein